MYQLLPGGSVLHLDTGVSFGPDPDNIDRQAYEAWLALGNTPQPAPASLSAPLIVTGDQWALAIGDLGLAKAWLAALAASKAGDRHRYGLVSRETALVVTDPLLARIAAASAGAISVAAVFAHARSMPR